MGGGQPGEMGELGVVASERMVHDVLGAVSVAEDVVGAWVLVDSRRLLGSGLLWCTQWGEGEWECMLVRRGEQCE